ncbi:MAG TPA: glycosyltransferase, partial [Pedococcus sp.]|nr:glycosyltransferase [Pedococcus sp.]
AALADSPGSAAAQDGSTPVVEYLWVLAADCVAAPTALGRLVDAVRRSPSVAVAGPKLLVWDKANALRSVGLQLTRSGRLLPSPVVGEPDQGQYDRRSDVLAVPSTGMLAKRSVCDELGWHDGLGEFGSEVDFGWRAQQSGRRVVVVPRATVRTGATPGSTGHTTTPRLRRQARRVALTRCSWWALPVLGAWIALSSLLAGVALLLAKQPRAAWAELSDLGAVLTPRRVATARWASRQARQVRRRDLAGLFVGPGNVLRHAGDLIHDHVAFEVVARPATGGDLAAVESGPVDDDAEDLNLLGSTWASRAARNPGLLAVLTATVGSVVASRHLGGGLFSSSSTGLAGGELVGVRADAWSTWHAWLDGWHGAGLGQGGEQGPYLVVLAGLSWVVAHVPVLGSPYSPLGASVAVLVALAMPGATLAAYLGSRVLTHSTWPRALAALAWGTTSVVTTAVAAGRLGALVAAMVVPLVAAGCVLAARRTGSTTATAATVLGAAILGAFAPALLVLVVAVGVLTVVLGRGWARLRGLMLALGPVLLLGPWVATLVQEPQLILTGPGLSVWGQAQALPWQLALLHPGGVGGYPVVLGAPLVLAGLLGLLRGGRRGAGAVVLGLVALAGLAFALAAPRLHLGVVPVDQPQGGQPISAWAGTGLLVLTLALLGSALHGSRGLPVGRAAGGWLAVARWPIAAALVASVLAGLAWTGWHSVGSGLQAWTDPRPAVAIDQAESGLSNRMLVLHPDVAGLRYQLLGSEPGNPVRTLPAAAANKPDTAELDAAVSALFEQGAAPGELSPSRLLADQAVGFVGLQTDASDPRLRQLDATAGLTRLGEHDGVIFWRVAVPSMSAQGDQPTPSRARVVTTTGEQAIPVIGPHGQVDVKVVVPARATLVLAEPTGWLRHARVAVDGRLLAPTDGRAAYALPAGAGQLTVEVVPTDVLWRYGQGLLLVIVAFLAVPLGNRTSRRRR